MRPPYTNIKQAPIVPVWCPQVLYSLCTCCVGMRDFRLAGALLSRLLQEDQASTAGLYAALGRLYLMLGDVASAQVGFDANSWMRTSRLI